MPQLLLDPTPAHKHMSYDERVCSVCMGHRALCGVRPCPLVMRAKAIANIEQAVPGTSLEGSSPPSVFVGSYGYPKVLAGPLVPPVRGSETALMERPDLWLDKTLDQILALRFSLIRTKRPLPVDAAIDPPRLLAETQTMALSETPTASEATLLKRPQFTAIISSKTLPIGPSAPLHSFQLEDNPSVPKAVNRVTSDTDLKAVPGVMTLFREGISQQHLTRLFSVGLLGTKRTRKLVPTEWSITAVDDIIGRRLHREVLQYEWVSDIMLFVDHALGNTVAILMNPGPWEFEALECWLTGPRPHVISDYEYTHGRKEYAKAVVGAYYATRLPVLEYLSEQRRQASAIVFMEIDPKRWVPLGVWRFREIARRALSGSGKSFSTTEEAIEDLATHLRNPVASYLEKSIIYRSLGTQTRLTEFF
ncbi:MAG: hypothetical protein HXY34_03960 [Candidatus Thorarchaeota archaeon]|nr:hypothetical protein [Candidatus Thorarchaeota archaeon]